MAGAVTASGLARWAVTAHAGVLAGKRLPVRAARVVGTGCLLAACATPRSAAPSEAPSTTVPLTRPAPPSTVPGVEDTLTPLSVSFSDPLHGAVVASTCAVNCRYVAWTSDDGGRTLQQAGTITESPASVPGFVDDVVVNGSELLAWGAGGAWTSHDGGATWSPQKLGDGVQDVLAVAAAGGSWWVVQDPSGEGTGDDVIMQGGGGHPFLALGGPIAGGVVGAARGSPTSAVLLYDDHLSVTDDGGQTWTQRERPCPAGAGAYSDGVVSEAPDGTLWLACAGEPSAGSQLKALYRSSDAGATWTAVEDCLPMPGRCSWPGGAFGYLVALASPSATSVWMGLARGTMVGTLDGGHTWLEPPVGGGDLGVSDIEFTDSQHGWAIVERGLWRTSDGGRTWVHVSPF
jgi:photosystem II stability/assembly factor-like uncharacterized protein